MLDELIRSGMPIPITPGDMGLTDLPSWGIPGISRNTKPAGPNKGRSKALQRKRRKNRMSKLSRRNNRK